MLLLYVHQGHLPSSHQLQHSAAGLEPRQAQLGPATKCRHAHGFAEKWAIDSQNKRKRPALSPFNMYIYRSLYIYTCMYAHVLHNYIHKHIRTYTCTLTYQHIHIPTRIRIYISMDSRRTHARTYTYIYTYIRMHVHVHVHLHVRTRRYTGGYVRTYDDHEMMLRLF